MITGKVRKRNSGPISGDSDLNHKRHQTTQPKDVSQSTLDRPSLEDRESKFSEDYEEDYYEQMDREWEEHAEKMEYLRKYNQDPDSFNWETAALYATRRDSYRNLTDDVFEQFYFDDERFCKVNEMIKQSFERHEKKFLETRTSKKRQLMHEQEMITLRQEILSFMQGWQTNEEAELMPYKRVANFEPTTLPKLDETHESKQANDDKVTLSEPTTEQNHYEKPSSGQLGIQVGGEQPKVKMKEFENPHFLSIIKHDSQRDYQADAAHCNVGGCVDKKPKLKQKSEVVVNEKLSNKQKRAPLSKPQSGATQRVSDSAAARSRKEVRRATAVASASGTSMAGVRNVDAEHGDGRGGVDKKPKSKQRMQPASDPAVAARSRTELLQQLAKANAYFDSHGTASHGAAQHSCDAASSF